MICKSVDGVWEGWNVVKGAVDPWADSNDRKQKEEQVWDLWKTQLNFTVDEMWQKDLMIIAL